jgi:predicted HTH transcriptional regulator
VWPFSRPLDSLSQDDLHALIHASIREGPSLEFKREMYRRTQKAQHEMVRDIAALANASGGALIIGMDQDSKGAASRLIPVDGRVDLAGTVGKVGLS